jgi:mannose-1-phosphate guanylyltransferase
MLSWALSRAGRLAPEERVVAVVAEQHREWWSGELESFPALNVIVQPSNRGTAAGVLLPLVCVARGDPDAVLAFLPSDHFVEDEDVLQQALTRAVRCVRAEPEKLVLLGMEPDRPETDYGWIVPGPRGSGGTRGVRDVLSFVEKPDAARAAELLSEGALWNSFLFVVKAKALLDLFGRAQPRLLWRFMSEMVHGGGRFGDVEHLYERLPVADFSRDVLQRAADRLAVVPVARCGWTDLGTPERVLRWRMLSAGETPAGEPVPASAGGEWVFPSRPWAAAR